MQRICPSLLIWERGFGDAPEVVAETIRFAADEGLVGCTIEDATGTEDHPLYDFGWLSNGLRQVQRRLMHSSFLHPDRASAQFRLRHP
jgi:2-methylisocitrate lyase-like PEP mutase family enzyme